MVVPLIASMILAAIPGANKIVEISVGIKSSLMSILGIYFNIFRLSTHNHWNNFCIELLKIKTELIEDTGTITKTKYKEIRKKIGLIVEGKYDELSELSS